MQFHLLNIGIRGLYKQHARSCSRTISIS